MKFDIVKVFVEVVRDYTIYHGRDINWKKRDLIRATFVYKVNECPWEIYCAWADK